MIRRGTQAHQQYEEQNKRSSSGGAGSYPLRMKAGETKILRFFGNFNNQEDPVSVDMHYCKALEASKQAYQYCGDQTCVFCYVAKSGNKSVGLPSSSFWLYCKDYSLSHKLDSETRVLKPGYRPQPGVAPPPSAYEVTKYPACLAPKRPCPYCRDGNTARHGGYRPFKLSSMHAGDLMTQIEAAKAWCASCLNESIVVTSYACANCGLAVEIGADGMAECDSCRYTLPPNEVIDCSSCDNPLRCDLSMFKVSATRTGDGQSTGYNFSLITPPEPSDQEELDEAAKYKPDWDQMLKPLSPDAQAALLQVPNPFAQRGAPGPRAQGYSQAAVVAPRQAPAAKAAPPTVQPRQAPPRAAPPVVRRPPVIPPRSVGSADSLDSEVEYE